MGEALGLEQPRNAGRREKPATAAGPAVASTGLTASCLASRDDGHCQRQPSGPLSQTYATCLLASLAVTALAGLMLFVPPIRQPEAYHAFLDARPLLGIPNFWNVVSNLPFLMIAVLGLRWLAARPANLAAELRPAYAVVFAGLGFTALGSVYYHWAPTTVTLFWDRLPIAVSFMALYAALLTERISLRWASALLWPCALFGAASAIFWHLTGDLRLYAFAQFFPVLTIPLVLWLFPAAYTRGADLMVGVGFYAVAKFCEGQDGAIYHALGELISGHTLKHLAAALGGLLDLSHAAASRAHFARGPRCLRDRLPYNVHPPQGISRAGSAARPVTRSNAIAARTRSDIVFFGSPLIASSSSTAAKADAGSK